MVVCQNMFHLELHNTYIQPNPLKKLSRSGSGWALFMPKTLLEKNTIKITKAENNNEDK